MACSRWYRCRHRISYYTVKPCKLVSCPKVVSSHESFNSLLLLNSIPLEKAPLPHAPLPLKPCTLQVEVLIYCAWVISEILHNQQNGPEKPVQAAVLGSKISTYKLTGFYENGTRRCERSFIWADLYLLFLQMEQPGRRWVNSLKVRRDGLAPPPLRGIGHCFLVVDRKVSPGNVCILISTHNSTSLLLEDLPIALYSFPPRVHMLVWVRACGRACVCVRVSLRNHLSLGQCMKLSLSRLRWPVLLVVLQVHEHAAAKIRR